MTTLIAPMVVGWFSYLTSDVVRPRTTDKQGFEGVQPPPSFSYLYDEADIQISKYSTDVKDDKMRAAWIEYKSKIRQSINQDTYPEKVIYPKIPTK